MNADLNSANIYASDVFEAVEIAEQLKKAGKCDIFRGQMGNYPLQPTIFRKGVVMEKAVERLNKFANWIDSVQELKSLQGNLDQITAIAQHYEMKTPFLDFTKNPQVAGFFASNGTSAVNSKLCCIVCVNQEVFVKSWAGIKYIENTVLARIVDIEIQNLWRIESQEGLFIEVRVPPDTLEMFSFFTRITFPYSVPYNLLTKDKIYPLKKSHLELMIDEFFSLESWEHGLIEAQKSYDATVNFSDLDFHFGRENAFVSNKLPMDHSSWTLEKINDWVREPTEKFADIQTEVLVTIIMHQNRPIIETQKSVKSTILEVINVEANCRLLSLEWNILEEDGTPFTIDNKQEELLEDDEYPQIKINSFVAYLWDGLGV